MTRFIGEDHCQHMMIFNFCLTNFWKENTDSNDIVMRNVTLQNFNEKKGEDIC